MNIGNSPNQSSQRRLLWKVCWLPFAADCVCSAHSNLAASAALESGMAASRAALKPKALGLGDGMAMGRPLKEIMNLTTKTDTLTFSPDSQVSGIKVTFGPAS